MGWNCKLLQPNFFQIVFPKLGFKLTKNQIDNLLNPFHCGKFEKDCVQGFFIYKVRNMKILHRNIIAYFEDFFKIRIHDPFFAL